MGFINGLKHYKFLNLKKNTYTRLKAKALKVKFDVIAIFFLIFYLLEK